METVALCRCYLAFLRLLHGLFYETNWPLANLNSPLSNFILMPSLKGGADSDNLAELTGGWETQQECGGDECVCVCVCVGGGGYMGQTWGVQLTSQLIYACYAN